VEGKFCSRCCCSCEVLLSSSSLSLGVGGENFHLTRQHMKMFEDVTSSLTTQHLRELVNGDDGWNISLIEFEFPIELNTQAPGVVLRTIYLVPK
jgi:hypothetical protein